VKSGRGLWCWSCQQPKPNEAFSGGGHGRLGGGIFIGSVYVRANWHTFHVDSRSSDVIALAIGNGVPICVARTVLDEAAVSHDDLEQIDPDLHAP
jgi:hypothetical protein